MKKLLPISILLLLAVGLVGYLAIDNYTNNRLEEAFGNFHLDVPNNKQTDEQSAAATARAEPVKATENRTVATPTSSGKKVRSFSEAPKEINNYAYNEGKVFKWIFRDQQVYVLDDAEQNVLAMNPEDGRIRHRFGRKGGAPWENEGVTSFEIADNQLYTLDNSKMAIRKSSVENPKEVAYFYKSENSFWDGILLDQDTYLVLTDTDSGEKGDFHFDVLDISQKKVKQSYDFRKLAGITDNSKYLNVAYEGYFLRNEHKEVFYICSKAGLFLKFDAAGNFQYLARTLDNRPAPVVTTKTFGNATIYIKEPDLNSNYAATADGQYLYILSLVRFKKSNNLAVDLYDVRTGDYHSSFELPNHEDQLPVEILKLDNNKLMVLYEDMQIVNYELQ
jgi:hypothetical protein